jgi:hypothetical protein
MAKDLLAAVLVYSRFFWDEFHVNNPDESRNDSSITLSFDLSCYGFQVADVTSVAGRRENTMFRLLL